MAAKKSSRKSGSKQRASGGGRTANSEPRVQVFKSFSGMNFEHCHAMLDADWNERDSQYDLMMTSTELQTNVRTLNNATMETERHIRKLGITLASDVELTGPACVVGSCIFLAAVDNGKPIVLKVVLSDGSTVDEIALKCDQKDFGNLAQITHICWAQERLLVFDDSCQVWRSAVCGEDDDDPGLLIDTIFGAVNVGAAYKIKLQNLMVHGSVKLSSTYDSSSFPHRVGLAWCIDTSFGPTEIGEKTVLYSSVPVSEWNETNYITVTLTIEQSVIDESYGAIAASLYYTVDDAAEYQFAQRAEFDSETGNAVIDWFGYVTDTTMWSIANLDAPNENYSMGPSARYGNMVDSRMYFWGGEHDYRVSMGGNPGNLLSTSPSTGGGYVDIEPGTGKFVNSVMKYKTSGGADIVTVMCGSRQSQEELRYNLVETTVSVSSDSSMSGWKAELVSGCVGCRNQLGAIVCEDGLYTVNRYGLALTTLTMEYNSQIRTSYVSDQVKPVFLADDSTEQMREFLLHCDGVIYYGRSPGYMNSPDVKRSVVFCYDVNIKAWWCITVPDTALNAFHVDSRKFPEGVGFVTPRDVYILPTTDQTQKYGTEVIEQSVVETGTLSTTQPNHGFHYLSQVELVFDWFRGEAMIEIIGTDIFGRRQVIKKAINSNGKTCTSMSVFMRVDMRLREYKLRIGSIGNSACDYRLSMFQSKLYMLPNKMGMAFGFDDEHSYLGSGDIHPEFKMYNDIENAMIP